MENACQAASLLTFKCEVTNRAKQCLHVLIVESVANCRYANEPMLDGDRFAVHWASLALPSQLRGTAHTSLNTRDWRHRGTLQFPRRGNYSLEAVYYSRGAADDDRDNKGQVVGEGGEALVVVEVLSVECGEGADPDPHTSLLINNSCALILIL